MIDRRAFRGMILTGVILAGCGGSTAPSTATVEPSASLPATTTHRLTLDPVGMATLPPILVTVPDGWDSGTGWAVALDDPSGDVIAAVTFWDVVEVYGHPCDWAGSLFDPGRGVRDLTDALVKIPLRNATTPVDVTVDGYSGTHLAWSVPDDFDFADCDVAGGGPAFESWTARGWSSDRYQQGPGQLDRLWILDVDGTRLVIDAFEMPDATDAIREQLRAIVDSIRFERS